MKTIKNRDINNRIYMKYIVINKVEEDDGFSYGSDQLLSLVMKKEIPALYLGRNFSYSVSSHY